jgi:hypothetical protein
MKVKALASLVVLVLTGCGAAASAQPTSSTAGPATSASVATPVTPSPLALTCTSSGQASPSWSVSPPEPAIVLAVVSDDTFTLTFSSGTPQFTVEQYPSAHFRQDASDLPVDLAGTAGVRIAMTGFRGDFSSYTGPRTLDSSGPLLLQVAEIGDWEGYVSWGTGLSGPACANVTASGSTLTFHFIPSP